MTKKKTTCNVEGCPDFARRSVEPCPMHRARALKGSRNATFAGALRDGTRTTAINIRCSPALKREVMLRASRLGISVGRCAEDLLEIAIDAEGTRSP